MRPIAFADFTHHAALTQLFSASVSYTKNVTNNTQNKKIMGNSSFVLPYQKP